MPQPATKMVATQAVCGVLSLWIFRLAGRYSLSIGGVAAAPRGGPAISFLWNGMTAALAAASARYGVSVAERLATDGRGGALRRAFSLDFPAGGSVLFIHWRGGSRAARRAGDFFFMEWNDGGAGRGVGEVWGQRRRAARNRWPWWCSAACFLSGFSGWRVGTLYPLAGWQPRRAAGRRFLFYGME